MTNAQLVGFRMMADAAKNTGKYDLLDGAGYRVLTNVTAECAKRHAANIKGATVLLRSN